MDDKHKDPGEERLDEMKQRIARLKRELKDKQRKVAENTTISEKKVQICQKSSLEKERENYFKNRKIIVGKRKLDESEQRKTVQVLENFKKKLGVVDNSEKNSVPNSKKEHDFICTLHSIKGCKSCRDTFGTQKDEGTEEGWKHHMLVFENEREKDLGNDPNELVVIDPRERMNSMNPVKTKHSNKT